MTAGRKACLFSVYELMYNNILGHQKFLNLVQVRQGMPEFNDLCSLSSTILCISTVKLSSKESQICVVNLQQFLSTKEKVQSSHLKQQPNLFLLGSTDCILWLLAHIFHTQFFIKGSKKDTPQQLHTGIFFSY